MLAGCTIFGLLHLFGAGGKVTPAGLRNISIAPQAPDCKVRQSPLRGFARLRPRDLFQPHPNHSERHIVISVVAAN